MQMQGDWLWHELHTPDPKKATGFYGKLLGWKTREMRMDGGHPYTLIVQNGKDSGGITNFMAPGEKPHWLVYVVVDNVDAAADQVPKLGGKVLSPPMDVPGVGRFTVVADPTGGAIALMTPAPR
jgi:hypothetical protein